MRAHEINKLDNFICGWYSDNKIIDSLIEYYEQSPDKKPGVIGDGRVEPGVKDSTDLILKGELFVKYYQYLTQVFKEYIATYPSCNQYGSWGIVQWPGIQHYKPGQGFHAWHCERTDAQAPTCNRHLVFMTYLNDVTDGGETEFLHQKVKIKPEKGLTVIWPADWTFTHRGLSSKTQDKYIVTGWVNYQMPFENNPKAKKEIHF